MKYQLDQKVSYEGREAVVHDYNGRYHEYTVKMAVSGMLIRNLKEADLTPIGGLNVWEVVFNFPTVTLTAVVKIEEDAAGEAFNILSRKLQQTAADQIKAETGLDVWKRANDLQGVETHWKKFE